MNIGSQEGLYICAEANELEAVKQSAGSRGEEKSGEDLEPDKTQRIGPDETHINMKVLRLYEDVLP